MTYTTVTYTTVTYTWATRCLSGKESTCQAGDTGSTPGLGKSLGEGNSNPLQYYCLENPMDRGSMGSQRVGHD